MLRILVCLLIAALIGIASCGRNAPAPKEKLPPISEAPPALLSPPPPPPVELNQVKRSLPAETQSLEGSGVTVWATGYEGELIAGRDGALYEPYGRPTMESVQRVLKDRGLYTGPVNGVLDQPTMKSLEAFQEANHHLLQRCGVPTPHTRKMLEQGSHTDLSSLGRTPQTADLR